LETSFYFRACGKIFCAECSEKYIPLPTEQIFQPVRVCKACFAKHTPQSSNGAVTELNPQVTVTNGISSVHKTAANQNGRADLNIAAATTTTYVPCNTNPDNSQHCAVSNNLPTTHAKIKKPLKANDGEQYRNGH
jgi:hypothetical protein